MTNEVFEQLKGENPARANLFYLEIDKYPNVLKMSDSVKKQIGVLCKSANIPKVYIDSDTDDFAYTPLYVALWNMESFKLRFAFEDWFFDHSDEKTDIRIKQLNRKDEVIRIYTFHGAYPSGLGSLVNNVEATNQIQTFDVKFNYDKWTAESP